MLVIELRDEIRNENRDEKWMNLLGMIEREAQAHKQEVVCPWTMWGWEGEGPVEIMLDQQLEGFAPRRN